MTSSPHNQCQQEPTTEYRSLLWALDGEGKTKRWVRAHLNYADEDWCLIWPFSRTTNDFPSIGIPKS